MEQIGITAFVFLFGILPLYLALVGLIRGEIHLGGWGKHTRSDSPIGFWIVVAAHVGVAAWCWSLLWR
jgi:hypothetical protein